jgi:hypothetical protein
LPSTNKSLDHSLVSVTDASHGIMPWHGMPAQGWQPRLQPAQVRSHVCTLKEVSIVKSRDHVKNVIGTVKAYASKKSRDHVAFCDTSRFYLVSRIRLNPFFYIQQCSAGGSLTQ